MGVNPQSYQGKLLRRLHAEQALASHTAPPHTARLMRNSACPLVLLPFAAPSREDMTTSSSHFWVEMRVFALARFARGTVLVS